MNESQDAKAAVQVPGKGEFEEAVDGWMDKWRLLPLASMPDSDRYMRCAGMARDAAWIFATYRPAISALADAGKELEKVKGERDGAMKFKTFVHAYLDQHGVPQGDPNNQHQKEGCRIGARLDLLFKQRDGAVELLREVLGESAYNENVAAAMEYPTSGAAEPLCQSTLLKISKFVHAALEVEAKS